MDPSDTTQARGAREIDQPRFDSESISYVCLRSGPNPVWELATKEEYEAWLRENESGQQQTKVQLSENTDGSTTQS
jgi:hypothetical protein